MSSWYTNLNPCPDIQERLDNLFTIGDQGALRDQTPAFDYLVSQNNTSGIALRVVPGNGRIRTVEAVYEQRLLSTASTLPASTTRTCTATTVRGDMTASYTIDPAALIRTEELLQEASFTYICENIDSIVQRKIQKLVAGHMLRVSKRVVDQMALLLSSNWSSDIPSAQITMKNGAAYAEIPTRLSGGVTLDPLGLAKLRKYLMMSNFGEASPIFATGEFYDYITALQAGCCATSGLDLQRALSMWGFGIAYDRLVGAAMQDSTNDGWVLRPGALQVLNYLRNNNGVSEAAGVTYGANYQKQVIYDPRTGWGIDLTISDACGAVSIILESNPKAVAMPSDMFGTGDHMAGNTFFNGIVVTNP